MQPAGEWKWHTKPYSRLRRRVRKLLRRPFNPRDIAGLVGWFEVKP